MEIRLDIYIVEAIFFQEVTNVAITILGEWSVQKSIAFYQRKYSILPNLISRDRALALPSATLIPFPFLFSFVTFNSVAIIVQLDLTNHECFSRYLKQSLVRMKNVNEKCASNV